MKNEVAVAERGMLPADPVLQMIADAARDPNVDVEKMRALLDMKREVSREQAEQRFNAAMNEVQAKIRPIAADASNPSTKSKYASYLALDKVLRPIYTAAGFSISYDTDASPIGADHIRVLAYVSCAGHTRTYHVDMPADGKGAKGGDVMTKTHAAGSAMRYGMRYLLNLIWNLAIGDDDDDGNAASAEPITSDQAKELEALIGETGTKLDLFLGWLKVDALAGIPAKHFARAKAELEAKKKAKGNAA